MFLRLLQKDFLKAGTRRAAKQKQNARSPQGGGNDPKQCPGDAQRARESRSGMTSKQGENAVRQPSLTTQATSDHCSR